MQTLYLNFPVFYQIVIKGNTSFRQSESVNLLLLGKPHGEGNERELSPSVVSNYVIGRKRLSSYLVTATTSCTNFELERRFRRLGLHNLDASIATLTNLLDKFTNISSSAHSSLLEEAKDLGHPYTFLIHLFRISLTCPACGYHTLTKTDLIQITALRPSNSENETPSPNADTLPEYCTGPTDQIVLKLGNKSEQALTCHEENALDFFKNSIPTIQMKQRLLNLPDDISPTINYLFETGADEVIPAGKHDLKNLLYSLDEKSTTILLEYYGSYHQILFACHNVPYLQNCLYLLILVEENTGTEICDIEKITSALEIQCPYDADIQTAVYHNEKQTVPLKIRLLYVVV